MFRGSKEKKTHPFRNKLIKSNACCQAFAKMLGSYTALSGGNCCSVERPWDWDLEYHGLAVRGGEKKKHISADSTEVAFWK